MSSFPHGLSRRRGCNPDHFRSERTTAAAAASAAGVRMFQIRENLGFALKPRQLV